jgi:hypothetical protein
MITRGEMGISFTNGSDTVGQITFNQFGTTDYSFNAGNLDYYRSKRISGYYPLFESYQLRLIVYGPKIGLYINSEPVGLMEYDAFYLSRGSFPILSLHSHGGIAAFSDFKVWNITDLEPK